MSNSPPSSALAAEGKTNASKHPQSHASKSIFLSQREKNTSPSSYPPDLIVNVCDREQQQSTVHSTPCAGVLRSATRGKDPLSPLKKNPSSAQLRRRVALSRLSKNSTPEKVSPSVSGLDRSLQSPAGNADLQNQLQISRISTLLNAS